MKVGAGGFITGIDIASDGTMVARTDTYGAYIWNGSSWTQLVTSFSMPETSFYKYGVYEIRIASSNSDIFYMTMSDGIYKTVDRGATWTKTSFPIQNLDPNSDNRMSGQKLAIDPSNPNVVFAGTQKDGLWVTRDGGTSWQKIAAVPQGTNTADPSMTGISIQGNVVYVGTAGSGVYASNDSGLTWKAIGGPGTIASAAISPDGSYYATGRLDGTLWKYSGGTWTKLVSDSNNGIHSVAVDPFDPLHVIIATPGGTLQESKDGGATWSGWSWYSKLESSADVPWLENTSKYMGSGGIVFDPLVAGKLWQAAGVGVWQTDIPSKMVWTDTVVWNSRSMGIEQLVANDIIAPAGGDLVLGSWDRAFISMPDPDTYATGYSGGDFSMGWSLDYASSNPNFLVGLSDWWGKDNSGYSTDGGKTWQKFAGLPSWAMNTIGGSIAASTPTNFVWAPSGNQPPAYTLDGGATWTNVSLPGVSSWNALHFAYYLSRTTISADRVQPNTFYLYDAASGVYRTTDGGVNWSKVLSGQISNFSQWNAKIEAVPGSSGELYFTSGPLGSGALNAPDGEPFMRSTDGGATWKALEGVKAITFGYGAAATSGGPATVYIVGHVNGDYGIFYSTDSAKTWTKIGDRPMSSLDAIQTISGDMDQFGLVYVGFAGSGYAYIDFGSSAPVAPTPSPAPAPTPPPSQVASILTAQDDTGVAATVANGALVNDGTPTLSGTLSAALASGQKLSVFRDGQQIGQVTPTSTSWSFTDPGAGDGKHDYVVRVVDALGQSGAASTTFSLTVDTVAPNQAVSVTGAAVSSSSAGSFSLFAASTSTTSITSTGAMVSGTVAGLLAADETLAVFRDGVRVGTATVVNGSWTFNDTVSSGKFQYSAQVQDAAGNLGKMSTVMSVTLGANTIEGTARNDVLKGTSGADQISGVGSTAKLGKATIDILTGAGGNDVFVLGDSRGRFYDDGLSRSSGTTDYARITDFSTGDKLQLKGSATDYVQGWINNLSGISGTGIYHDTNGNGVLDSRDELIALVQNAGPLDQSAFIYV